MSEKITLKFNLKADEPNQNGTVYTADALKEAVNKLHDQVVTTGICGIAGQPITPELEHGQAAFELKWIKNNDDMTEIEGEIEFIDSESGKLLQNLINNVGVDEYRLVTYAESDNIEQEKMRRNGKEKDVMVVKKMNIKSIGVISKDKCA